VRRRVVDRKAIPRFSAHSHANGVRQRLSAMYVEVVHYQMNGLCFRVLQSQSDGNPAAFPNVERWMEVAALPSPWFSQGSSVVRPPPTPCSASLLRFRGSPLYASLPDGVASAGPNRVSPVVLMHCLCVPPPSTPSRQTGSILAVFRSVAGFASKGQARPGKRSS
jgi:hypothetical protein